MVKQLFERKPPVDDARCGRCDDSGLVGATGKVICTCAAGGIVLDQRAARGM